MTWRHGTWSVDHALPFGVTGQSEVGRSVIAGDIIATGSVFGSAVQVRGARQLGLRPEDLGAVQRVRPGGDVARGGILARGQGRFARAAVAPIEGRLLHLTTEGDFVVAPLIGHWSARATLDGTVVRSDDATITVEGAAWCLPGLAAYGPDAVGELALVVDVPVDEISPSRLDVRLRGRILVGGSRMAAEAITRAHACGAVGLVAGAAPAGGLRVVYGDEVTAGGLPSQDDRPTVLCLVGFGSAAIPDEIFRPLIAFSGLRAAIHTASARLFVFAGADVVTPGDPPAIALAEDHAAVGALEAGGEIAGVVQFASGVEAEALLTGSGPVPLANIRPFDAAR